MPFLAFVVWVAAMWLGFVAFPVVFALALAATVLAAAGIYFRQAGRVLLPDVTDGHSPIGLPGQGGDPAYRHYLVTQVWRDWWAITRGAYPKIVITAADAVRATTKALIGDARGVFLFPIWLAVCAGVILAALPLAALGLLITGVYALTVAAGMLAWLACVTVLRAVEQVFTLVRRILQACPYPGCYARITLPAYACPACGERHRALTPNLNGAVRHACRCGARLPTTILLGRHRLQAHCPECDRLLPARIGRVRVEPLPFVGGPDAGKTTFMALAVDALLGASGLRAEFVDQGDELTFHQLKRQLADGRMIKTGTQLPKAVMLDVTLPREGSRILYLFDPSGEHYTGASEVEAMSYLAHGEALLILVDPFALPAVQDSLVSGDRELLAANGLRPSREDPADTVHRVRNELAGRADGGRQRRIAVVVTKADLLRQTATGGGAQDDPAGWLAGMGMGNLTRALAASGAKVRYFLSGIPADAAEILDLLTWLIGLRPGAKQPAGETRPRRPWIPRSRPPERPPLSYTVARRLIFGVTVVLSLAAVVLLALAGWAWLR
ncbi:hypothetical protein Aph01nite_38770 [Acrocarpospora phusangensis]|uniref:Double-GTPase 2 domain-containing protein n=1 Tax=Acrocarpospora phusangensis TaxID=1070424 RepID=A0A919QAX5_9ACTN|nr:hypothetical protein [Acrocarpospora phusangensis]GIH25567.1 hypothetical protein Aph01nite_38770 [Acrocarpospora phusangensis]